MAVDPDELDKLLVEELNELSIGDRERVLDEIHGISAADTFESGDKEALDRMQEELDRIYNDACENTGTADGVATRSGSSSKRRRSLDRTAASTTSSDPLDAYIEARTGNSLMILDTQFLYGFLVVENLDPKRAALRMTKYLKFIRELYGKSDVLYRPIFIDDMHPDAHEEFLNGPLQILPERDSSGRRIFVYLRDFSEKVDNKYSSQVYMYFHQRLLEEQAGMVNVTFLHNSKLFTGKSGNDHVEDAKKLIACLPSKFKCIHLCMPDNPLARLVKSAVLMIMERYHRYRVRVHFGSPVECHYSLAPFGIPVHRLPTDLDLNKTLRKDNISYHTKWVRMQNAKEIAIGKIHFERHQDSMQPKRRSIDSDDASDSALFAGTKKRSISSDAPEIIGMKAVDAFRAQFIEIPRHEDCLFGRGRNTMKHPGNVAMRALLDERRERYAKAAHQKKSQLAWEIVREIKTGGGQFLRELETGFFTRVDDETARKKISIAFRDSKKKKTQKQQKQQQEVQQKQEPGSCFSTGAQNDDNKCFSSGNDNCFSSGTDSDNDCFNKYL